MYIDIIDEQNDLDLNQNVVSQIVKSVIAFEGQSADEVAVHFVDTPTICRLHEEFFDDPTTTDCISFPIDDEETPGLRMLGEVFVCPETAILYAAEHNTDPLRETQLYVVHGLLHLMGYDDIADDDRNQMREAEQRHMAHLDQNGISLNSLEKT